MKCVKCGLVGNKTPGEINSKFVLNSKIEICNDCWLKLSEKEMSKIRIKDWRIK